MLTENYEQDCNPKVKEFVKKVDDFKKNIAYFVRR